ncbi:M42 family metallopeptidase [Gorillibacterium sp. sgz500922]|uniref:M42 family metallopeptidase n=1 Tax=Gorillibacterium sp. sgz500922 TaxID=3446694 RepID=UPI003F67E922
MKNRINQAYVKTVLEDLLAIPSPTGYAHRAIGKVREEAEKLGVAFETTPKGMGILTVPGKGEEVLGLTGHVDTLGAMVRSIKSNGRLRLTSLGGFMMNSIEGEYVQVHTREGKVVTGTILTKHPSVHVYADARDQKREEANMEVRLDADVSSREDVQKLGIRVGDIISFNPRTEWQNGYLKSRHLDDKAGVACLLGLLELLKREGLTPQKTLKVCITTYEEVGHGASYMPEEIRELLAVDMGAMGDDLSCTEKDVSICAKDSSGPYDYEMTSKLIRLAERDGLSFAVDIYPSYSSDASAALRGGSNLRAALIGPGVHASHSMERTHEEALWNTIALLAAYITE